jgi:sec-independent protein translocase protein TatC
MLWKWLPKAPTLRQNTLFPKHRKTLTPSMTNSSLPETTVPANLAASDSEPGAQMTFFEHLVDLRKRIINSLYAVGIGAFVGVYVSKYFINWITKPMLKALSDAHLDPKLVYTHPAGYLNLVITLGVYIGIVLASPIVLYQVWLFVAPALYKHERSAISGFLFSTVFLFLSGIAFGYYVTLPYMLHFLVSFQGPVVPMISINEYFDLILMVLLGLGLVFELPILIFFLSLFGIVTPTFLWKNFRYAILVIAVVAAIVTPTPDATTMLIFMAPMVSLYIVGIGVSAMVVRKREKRLAAGEAH